MLQEWRNCRTIGYTAIFRGEAVKEIEENKKR